MSRRDDDRDEQPPERFLRSLLELLRELEEYGDARRSGSEPLGPWTGADVSVDVGERPGGTDRFPAGTPSRRPGADDLGAGRPVEYHATTREVGNELVVAVDLPVADSDSVAVELDAPGTLVVEAGMAEPVDVAVEPGDWRIVDRRFENGILEVTLGPTRDDDR